MDKFSFPILGGILIGIAVIGVAMFSALRTPPSNKESVEIPRTNNGLSTSSPFSEIEDGDPVDEIRLSPSKSPTRPEGKISIPSNPSQETPSNTPSYPPTPTNPSNTETNSTPSSSSSDGGGRIEEGMTPPPPPPSFAPPGGSSSAAPSGAPSFFSGLNDIVRASVVNILCETNGGGSLRPISASGVMVSKKGVIMTNAHVAQYFLLKNYPTPNYVTCIIRTGSPAAPAYTAEILYISPQWIEKNALNIRLSEPRGTGEHDFAFLRITGSMSGAALPSSFPFVPPDTAESDIQGGAGVLIAGYPASFVGASTVMRDLYAASTFSTIGEIFTFVKTTADLFSVGGTVLAQKGASGGAVVTLSGKLIGMVATAQSGETTGESDLRALSLFYINRALAEDAGITIDGLLQSDLVAYANTFNATRSPALTQILINVLGE